MARNLGSQVMTSDLHPLPDGKRLMISFTPVEETTEFKTIFPERALDQGSSWESGFYQYMTGVEGAGTNPDKDKINQ